MNCKTTLTAFLVSLNSHAALQLTFEEAVQLAQRQNPELQSSTLNLEASRAEQKATRGNFLPNLDFVSSYDKTKTETLTTTSDGKTFSNSLTLSQNLFNGKKDYSNLNISSSAVRIEEANLQEKKAELSYLLQQAVADYFYAKNSIQLSEEIKKRRVDNLSLVQLRYESGRENKGSVLLSKAYLDQAELDLLSAKNQYQNSISSLQKILNLGPSNEEIIINSEPNQEIFETDNKVPDFDSLVKNIPSTKKYLSTLEQKQYQLQSARSSFYPSWDVKASVAYSGNDFLADDQKRYLVGTSLTWSLFNGGSDYYHSTSAAYAQKTAEKILENNYLELRKTLKENYSNMLEAKLAVKTSQSFLNAAKTRAEIARSKYNNGLMQFDDWDSIENELISRQKDFLNKKRTLKISMATWEKSIGTGVIK